jgi:hypothetical protein
MIARPALFFIMCLVCATETFAQGPTPNVNDGTALQRECKTALKMNEVEEVEDEPGAGALGRGSDMGQCLGLVSGVWHTHMMMVDEFDSGSAFCPTNSISAGEMARIVDHYLETHPVEMDQWDTVLILRAFMLAYPCS